MTQNILLGHLGSNGDCLYATTVARQIRRDFPGCHLTWAISSLTTSVIWNNPDVDEVWEVPLQSWADLNPVWELFEAEAWTEVHRGRFDHAFLTQICPNYFANYDGTIRPSIFRNYPRPITVPVETVIALTDGERQRVEDWIEKHGVRAYENVVLFECSSKSGQSFVTPSLALAVAERVIRRNPDTCIILSTHEKVASDDPCILHGGELSLRETAALTHAADLFVGCGSGLTVVATSGAAKPNLPNIQVLSKESSVFASFRHDFEYFGKPNGHFLEMTSSDPDHLAGAVLSVLDSGLSAAKQRYNTPVELNFRWYRDLIELMLVRKGRYIAAAQSLMTTAGRYGWHEELLDFGAQFLWPHVRSDEREIFPRGQETIERFEGELHAQGRRPVGSPSVAADAGAQEERSGPRPSPSLGGGMSRRWTRIRRGIGIRLLTRHPWLYRMALNAERAAWRLFR